MRSYNAKASCRRRSRGFTLIELLVTVSIIGILAALAIPRFGNIREKGFDVQVRADARSCANAEEGYYVDAGQYASDLNALSFQPSPGSNVSITAGNTGSLATSFSVTVTHPGMSYTSGCTWTSDGVPRLSCS